MSDRTSGSGASQNQLLAIGVAAVIAAVLALYFTDIPFADFMDAVQQGLEVLPEEAGLSGAAKQVSLFIEMILLALGAGKGIEVSIGKFR